MKTISRRLLLSGIAGGALIGCSRSRSVSSKSKGRLRVVSLSPNMTEIVFAIGRGDWLVGRSRFCDYPPEVSKIPVVGGFADPSMEAILSARPDIVLGARGPAGQQLTRRLTRHRIPCLFPETNSIEQINDAIMQVGTKLAAGSKARSVVNRIEADLRRLGRLVEHVNKPNCLLVFGHRPLVVCGPNTFPNEMLSRAGAHNVVTSGKQYPVLSPETVLKLAPELIVDASFRPSGSSSLQEEPGFDRLNRLSRTRIVELHDNTVMRPGPRVAHGVALLTKAIHPSLEVPL